jgi:uracil-DNA glycosylase
MFSLTEIDSSWQEIFHPHIDEIQKILSSVAERDSTPPRELIFRTFSIPIDRVKVVILGQDPYPSAGIADGLAFSSSRSEMLPASLRNIFVEYCADLGFEKPLSGDLTPWLDQGVLLLNTALTTEVGARNADKTLGWGNLINAVINHLIHRDVIAILWGNSARNLGSHFEFKVESAHPSPLSAYRGFFGSQPFSKANGLLQSRGLEPIDWKIP